MSNQAPKKTSSVPRGVFIVHALVVLAVIADVIHVNLMPVSLDRLGPVLVLFLGVIPGALCFLSIYTVAATQLWSRRPQWGIVPIILLSMLAGIAFLALSVGLLFLAWKVESMVGSE